MVNRKKNRQKFPKKVQNKVNFIIDNSEFNQELHEKQIKIGEILYNLRINYPGGKLTQDEVSEKLGLEYGVDVSRQYISRLELGEVQLKQGTLHAFSKLYNVSYSYILGETEPASPETHIEKLLTSSDEVDIDMGIDLCIRGQLLSVIPLCSVMIDEEVNARKKEISILRRNLKKTDDSEKRTEIFKSIEIENKAVKSSNKVNKLLRGFLATTIMNTYPVGTAPSVNDDYEIKKKFMKNVSYFLNAHDKDIQAIKKDFASIDGNVLSAFSPLIVALRNALYLDTGTGELMSLLKETSDNIFVLYDKYKSVETPQINYDVPLENPDPSKGETDDEATDSKK